MTAPGAAGPTAIFGPLAASYAAARPGYPDALFDALLERLPAGAPRAMDLAAGTGAATGSLLAAGARAAAVEPNLAMLERAAARLAGRPGWLGAVAARGEALPVRRAALDLVTVAQAFHWLEPEPALDELAAAIRPGGVLGVFWNVTVEDAFAADVRDLLERWNPRYGRPVTRRMLATPPALAGHAAFAVDPPREFAHDRAMTADRYVAYAFSWSYCGGALAPEAREPFEVQLRDVIRRHHGEGEWRERLVAVLHLAVRA